MISAQEVTPLIMLRRFFHIGNYDGIYITGGNLDKHIVKMDHTKVFEWAKTMPHEFLAALTVLNDDKLISRRETIFYLLAKVLTDKDLIPANLKLELRTRIVKFCKTDRDFFDFIKFFTLERNSGQQRISNSCKKIILQYYKEKSPRAFARSIVHQEKCHGWSHKDLIKLSHYKSENSHHAPIVSYLLFGPKRLPDYEGGSTDKEIISLLKKSYELNTTVDVNKAASLITELHVPVTRINSKINKREEVWQAAIPEMTVREVLRWLYNFYKFGFLKTGHAIQTKIVEALTSFERIKRSKVHPLEVFVHLKFFEKGGKVVDPKLIDYLQKRSLKEETLNKITNTVEPKCHGLITNIHKCLKISYKNIQPTGKKFLLTIDTMEKLDATCFHSRRITCYEAIFTIYRFLAKVERDVTVAFFQDDQIVLVDLSKCGSMPKFVERVKENVCAHIQPVAPIEWATKTKKPFDVFINVVSHDWRSHGPKESRIKSDLLQGPLNKYAKKMKNTDVRVVKLLLNGTYGSAREDCSNILNMYGFSEYFPKVLEAFCRGNFC